MKININKIKASQLKKQEFDEYLKLVSIVKSNMEHPEGLEIFLRKNILKY